MTDKDKNIVNFRQSKEKQEEDEVPPFLIEQIELLLEQAKAGNVKTAIIHFDHTDDNDEYLPTSTLLWNHDGNALELVGVIELIKAVALDNVFMGGEDE